MTKKYFTIKVYNCMGCPHMKTLSYPIRHYCDDPSLNDSDLPVKVELFQENYFTLDTCPNINDEV